MMIERGSEKKCDERKEKIDFLKQKTEYEI